MNFDGENQDEVEVNEDEEDEDDEDDPFSKLPMPENWVAPRLLYIDNKNNGYELLNNE